MNASTAYANLERKMISMYGAIPHEVYAEMVALFSAINAEAHQAQAEPVAPVSVPEATPEAVTAVPPIFPLA